MNRQIICIILLASSFILQLNCSKIDLKAPSLSSLATELKAENTLVRTEINASKSESLNESYNLNCCSNLDRKNCDILIPSYNLDPFEVPCENGWIVVIRRIDGSVLFQRDWKTYKNGFGEVDGEYFIGLDKLHALTEKRSMELLFMLEDHEGVVKSERYERFAIGNEEEQYILHTLGVASGTARDSFRNHHGMKFTTFDRDNDLNDENNCAEMRTGGWWYRSCHYSHLTGAYGNNDFAMGVIWYHFRGDEYSLKRAVMMIRPKK